MEAHSRCEDQRIDALTDRWALAVGHSTQRMPRQITSTPIDPPRMASTCGSLQLKITATSGIRAHIFFKLCLMCPGRHPVSDSVEVVKAVNDLINAQADQLWTISISIIVAEIFMIAHLLLLRRVLRVHKIIVAASCLFPCCAL